VRGVAPSGGLGSTRSSITKPFVRSSRTQFPWLRWNSTASVPSNSTRYREK
jgi:hypothetical protein